MQKTTVFLIEFAKILIYFYLLLIFKLAEKHVLFKSELRLLKPQQNANSAPTEARPKQSSRGNIWKQPSSKRKV